VRALKEWDCVEVGHHKNIGQTIIGMQEKGWIFHTYQASGFGTDVKHYCYLKKELESKQKLTNSLRTAPQRWQRRGTKKHTCLPKTARQKTVVIHWVQ
jgi:hypothetical protein